MMRVSMTFALAAMLGLSGCSYNDAENAPAPIRDREARTLAKELDGKVSGEPQNCISTFSNSNFIRISDDTLLYRESGRLVYKNRLRSACPGLARDNDIIVTERFSSQLCRGDLIRLVDRTSGIPGPVCSLGEFVPYRKAG
ncbi:MAG: DUF6491 family protein [Sphingorhabdus sp.]